MTIYHHPQPSALEIGWLFQSIEKDEVENVRLFIETYGRGAVQKHLCNVGQTAFHLAVIHHIAFGKSDAIVKLMMAHDVNPLTANNQSDSVAVFAAKLLKLRKQEGWGTAHAGIVATLQKYEQHYTDNIMDYGIDQPLTIRRLVPKFTAAADGRKPASPDRGRPRAPAL